jgi:hypothetical protein
MAQGHDAQTTRHVGWPIPQDAHRSAYLHVGGPIPQDAHKGRPYYGRGLVGLHMVRVKRRRSAWVGGWMRVDSQPRPTSRPTNGIHVAFTRKTFPRRKSPSIVGTLLVRVLPTCPRPARLRTQRGECWSASYDRVRPASDGCSPHAARASGGHDRRTYPIEMQICTEGAHLHVGWPIPRSW